MKTLQHLFVWTFVAGFMAGCGNQANKGETQAADTVVVDTFSSPDLTQHELKGHVRTCKTVSYPAVIKDNAYVVVEDGKGNPTLLTFTEQGYLKRNRIYDLTYDVFGKLVKGVNLTDDNMKISVKRNKKGYMTALICQDKRMGMQSDQAYRINYKWNKKNQMIKEEYKGWEWASVYYYQYDENGLLQERSNQESPDYETEVDHTTTYVYTRFDGRGNWTERNVQTVSVTSAFDLDTGKRTTTGTEKKYAVEKREIAYFGE